MKILKLSLGIYIKLQTWTWENVDSEVNWLIDERNYNRIREMRFILERV